MTRIFIPEEYKPTPLKKPTSEYLRSMAGKIPEPEIKPGSDTLNSLAKKHQELIDTERSEANQDFEIQQEAHSNPTLANLIIEPNLIIEHGNFVKQEQKIEEGRIREKIAQLKDLPPNTTDFANKDKAIKQEQAKISQIPNDFTENEKEWFKEGKTQPNQEIPMPEIEPATNNSKETNVADLKFLILTIQSEKDPEAKENTFDQLAKEVGNISLEKIAQITGEFSDEQPKTGGFFKKLFGKKTESEQQIFQRAFEEAQTRDYFRKKPAIIGKALGELNTNNSSHAVKF